MSIERLAKIKALMKEKSQAKTMRPQFWKPSGLVSRVAPSRKIQGWLTTPKSLTAKLKTFCSTLQVVVLSEKMEIPLLNESQKLGLAHNEEAWVRCVLLKCHDKSWVYARTVIPKFESTNPWNELQHLGNKPLGEVLFEMSSIQRSPFEFSKDKLSYWPYLTPTLSSPETTDLNGYARRSIFHQKHAPLLLTEVFLPGLVKSSP